MITDSDIVKLKTIFATKKDLEKYATKEDVQTIVELHDDKIDQKLTQFRSDIIDKLNLVIGELKANREEREIIAHQVSDHEDRLETIETHLHLSS